MEYDYEVEIEELKLMHHYKIIAVTMLYTNSTEIQVRICPEHKDFQR